MISAGRPCRSGRWEVSHGSLVQRMRRLMILSPFRALWPSSRSTSQTRVRRCRILLSLLPLRPYAKHWISRLSLVRIRARCLKGNQGLLLRLCLPPSRMSSCKTCVKSSRPNCRPWLTQMDTEAQKVVQANISQHAELQHNRIQALETKLEDVSKNLCTKQDMTALLAEAMSRQTSEFCQLMAKRSPEPSPAHMGTEPKAQKTTS